MHMQAFLKFENSKFWNFFVLLKLFVMLLLKCLKIKSIADEGLQVLNTQKPQLFRDEFKTRVFLSDFHSFLIRGCGFSNACAQDIVFNFFYGCLKDSCCAPFE
jgi:hypothetical protein